MILWECLLVDSLGMFPIILRIRISLYLYTPIYLLLILRQTMQIPLDMYVCDGKFNITFLPAPQTSKLNMSFPCRFLYKYMYVR